MRLISKEKFFREICIVAIFSLALFVPLHSSAQEERIDTLGRVDSVSHESLPVDGIEEKSGKDIFYKRIDTLLIQPRSSGDVQSIKSEDDFWYAGTNLEKSKEEVLEERQTGKNGVKGDNEEAIEQRKKSLSYQPWFQNLLWLLIIGGFVVFLVIYLGNSNVTLFRRKSESISKEQEEELSEDIFGIDYRKEIDKAIFKENFRLAVRLHFLKLLKTLSDRNIIRYKQDKTNLDYLLELHSTAYYDRFFRVTRNYEYSWYGQFPVSRDAYAVIKKDFDALDSELH